MISVGLVLGSPSATVVRDVVQRLMRFLKAHRGTETPTVTLVFRVPGIAAPARFYGVEVGDFDEIAEALDIQIGVEEEWLDATELEVIQYVFDVSNEAISVAKSRLTALNIAFDVVAARDLLSQWRYHESPQ